MPLALTLLAAVGYGLAWYRLSRRGHRWPDRRAACMLAGSLCVGIALLPPLASQDDRFEVHVIQHLLLAMVAPAFLALSAPATLALRTLPRRARRALLRVLHSPAVSVLTAPATAVTLVLGGLYVLYLTALYQAAEHDSVIHAVVHLHMFLAGCLLSWAVIGIDPIRRRPGTRGRLAALFIAAAGHDILAKLMYAWMLPAGGGPAAGRRLGAELMYYGGTAIDVALAVIVMTQWYLAAGRALARTRRRVAAPAETLPPRAGNISARLTARRPAGSHDDAGRQVRSAPVSDDSERTGLLPSWPRLASVSRAPWPLP
jgi:putative membrane protein